MSGIGLMDSIKPPQSLLETKTNALFVYTRATPSPAYLGRGDIPRVGT
jgi:hypothetical protein